MLRGRLKKLAGLVDVRDAFGLLGLALAGYGLERIYPGAGFAATGLILVALAVFIK